MYKKRKLYFFKLSQEKETYIDETNTTRISILEAETIKNNFLNIYSKKTKQLSNGNRAINVHLQNNNYVIEIISLEENVAFIKIGQQNPSYTVALRDENTLESEAVKMSESQLLELYTYAIIDFETLIVSYIGINGAPKISAVEGLFNTYLSEQKIYTKLAAIMTNDILQTLIKKEIISKFLITVAVPNDEILSNVIGLNRLEFDAFNNLKTQTVTYKLVANRNKNIFTSSSKLAELIATIKAKFGDNLTAVTANAKDKNENSQIYNLLQYSFTKTILLGDGERTIILEEDFKNALINTYHNNKEELLRYSRV